MFASLRFMKWYLFERLFLEGQVFASTLEFLTTCLMIQSTSCYKNLHFYRVP